MGKNLITDAIIEEADKWILVIAFEKYCFDRYTDEINSSTQNESRRKAYQSEYVIEDGRLIGFDLRSKGTVGDYEDILRIPGGTITRSDSYSSFDWEENIYEKTTVTLEKDNKNST